MTAFAVAILCVLKLIFVGYLWRLRRQHLFGRNMTRHALLFDVFVLAVDFKIRDVMVERLSFDEIRGRMTIPTTFFQKLFAELFFMNGLVAVNAEPFFSMGELVLFLTVDRMAGTTRGLLMFSGKREASFVMEF